VTDNTNQPPYVWGLEAIGQIIDRSPRQVSELMNKTNVLDGAVRRLIHKQTIGIVSKLRSLDLSKLPRRK
jgi:hypothetical protein